MNKMLNRIKQMSLLEASLSFIIVTLIVLMTSITSYDMFQQDLNYQLLKHRQIDLQQLIKDHPDQKIYQEELDATNILLENFSKT